MSDEFGKKKNNWNFSIALTGILSALAFLFCFLAGVSPVLGISLLVISSFIIGVIIVETNITFAVISYQVIGLMVLMFVPEKTVAVFAFFFFLPYPIAKKLIEKDEYLFTSVDSLSKKIFNWICKVLCFVLGIGMSFFVLFCFFGVENLKNIVEQIYCIDTVLSPGVTRSLLVVVSITVFVIYDILFSQLGRIYLFKYSRYLRRNKQ